jgi:hypothetical protein
VGLRVFHHRWLQTTYEALARSRPKTGEYKMPPQHDAELVRAYLAEPLAILEQRLRSSPDVDFASLFGDLDDDIFFSLMRGHFSEPVHVRQRVPDWPNDEIRMQSTGAIPFNLSALEAHLFWSTVRRLWSRDSNQPIGDCRVADYGAGWGRIARYSSKDLPRGLYSFEPNPVFCDLYKSCRVPGMLVQTDFGSEGPLHDHGLFDIVYSFSILTHASDALARRIMQRWKELTTSGSVIFATVRPSDFIEGTDGDAGHFDEKARLRDLLARGELVYRPYPGDNDWGVAIMPLPYLAEIAGSDFTIDGFYPHPLTSNQVVVRIQRN